MAPTPHEVELAAHPLSWLALGVIGVAVLQLPLALRGRAFISMGAPSATAATGETERSADVAATASSSARAAAAEAAPSAILPTVAAALPPPPDAATPPHFRVARLRADPSFEVMQARVGKRTCEAALASLGVSRADIARVATALAPVRPLAHCRAADRLYVASTAGDHRFRALEWETAPGDLALVHARALDVPLPSTSASGAASGADPDELLAVAVRLPVTHKRHAVSFIVSSDLATAVQDAGQDPSILEPLDDALGSRADHAPIGPGAVFRVVADATYVADVFDRYDEVVAIELRPRADAPPLRLYHLVDPGAPEWSNGKQGRALSWFDAKGHQPVRGRWRMPLAFARIASRFNPRRFHPILRAIVPHNGCDFAAPAGSPVYAIGAGVVEFRGDGGPSGNLVTLRHDGGIESGYAHLSRFAPGIVPGAVVEARGLVGYVGSTGRSTGPHLHLSAKRNGVFIDPLSLKLDGVRVVPTRGRAVFTRRRLEADAALDAIPAPTKPEVAAKVPAGEDADEPQDGPTP